MSGRTALDIPREAWEQYRPRKRRELDRARWERAWAVAREVAHVLKSRFGASRVVAFGSLVQKEAFTRWSDIDLAVWGIAAEDFYKAVAFVTGFSSEFEIDLVDIQMCSPALQERIELEGVEL